MAASNHKPLDGAPTASVEVERLREECGRLRHLAAAQAAEMESLRRRTDEFVAIASHDLRSPLTVIIASAQRAGQRLARPSLDLEEVGHALNVIHRQSRTMARLAEDLPAAARHGAVIISRLDDREGVHSADSDAPSPESVGMNR